MAGTGDGDAGGPPAIGSQLGAFELTEPVGSWAGQSWFHARGAVGTAHEGMAALVVVAPIAGQAAPLIDAAGARLQAIAAVRHECVLPTIEAGAWEGGLYLAHQVSGSEMLADRLARVGPYGPLDALAVIDGLAAALDTLAAAGVPHGDVRLANVWLRPDGRPLLGGFVIAADETQSAAADAFGLSVVLASLLAGGPLADASGAGVGPVWDPPFGVPEVVHAAVRRGFGPDLAQRYPSAGSLAAAYRESIASAAAIQVAGAWEAIERRDYAMARIVCDAALALRPDDREIQALLQHINLNAAGGGWSSSLDRATRPTPIAPAPDRHGAGAPAMPAGAFAAAASPSADLALLPPELAELLAVPPPAKVSGANAWVAFATGMIFLVALTLIVALLAMTYR